MLGGPGGDVIPLLQRLFHAQQGFVFRRLFGELTDPMAWVLPVAVLGVGVLIVTVLGNLQR